MNEWRGGSQKCQRGSEKELNFISKASFLMKREKQFSKPLWEGMN